MEKEDEEINWDSESSMTEEKGEAPPPPPPPPPPAGHHCKECNKSFTSGKALGGHMSSAHVQANKDYSCKKLKNGPKSKLVQEDMITCPLCDKIFPSRKSLFGHMRCHPDRRYRGMEPPPEYSFGLDRSGLASTFQDWPSSSKRSRAYVRPDHDQETFSAGHQLLKLIGGRRPESSNSSSVSDSEDEVYRTAIEVLVELKRAKIESESKLKIIKTADQEPIDGDQKVVRGFDLNMVPEMEEDHVNGDHCI